MSLAVRNHERNCTGALGALITMAAFGTHPERARTALQRCKNQVLRQPYRAFDDFRKRPACRIETTAVPAYRAPIVRERLDAAHGSQRRIVHQDRTLTSGSGARQFERRSYAVTMKRLQHPALSRRDFIAQGSASVAAAATALSWPVGGHAQTASPIMKSARRLRKSLPAIGLGTFLA